MSRGYLLMRGHVLFSPGGPLGIDKVHSQLVTRLCNRKRERNQRGRVRREIHDAATETVCSPGQHNEALSRMTWFECTSDGKGKRCTAPYASTHHVIFPQPWMRSSHRQPPLLSDSQSQNLSQDVLYTMQRKTLSWVCTEQNPWGGQALSSGCKTIERFRERALQKERWVCISQNSGEHCHIALSPSCGLFSKFVYCKTSFTFVLLTVAVFNEHSKTVVGPAVMAVAAFISVIGFNWYERSRLRSH